MKTETFENGVIKPNLALLWYGTTNVHQPLYRDNYEHVISLNSKYFTVNMIEFLEGNFNFCDVHLHNVYSFDKD